MKLAIFIKKDTIREEKKVKELLERLSDFEIYDVRSREELAPGTDMLLSLGGDGTFLSATGIVAGTDVPVFGVNFGRLGFLSDNGADDVVRALKDGSYVIEDREMLSVRVDGGEEMFAFNEMSLHRNGAAMLGLDVKLGKAKLPTYWADGLLVATSSGSTAYSLSVGGPICIPGSKVFILAPIAPHNLNVRPLVIPSDLKLSISTRTRDDSVTLTVDNSTLTVGPASNVDISMAQFSLKTVRLPESSFVKALTTKLFWGEDVRNGDKF